MKTKAKIWLGVGAFALVQAAGVSMEAGRPSITLTQPALADGRGENACGRYYYEGEWRYRNCGRDNRGERWNQRSERWNERGERWNERDNRWERGDRWHDNGRDRWGERG